MIVPRGTAGAQSTRQPVGTASAQSVIPSVYAMPQSVVLPIAGTALLTARTLARYHFRKMSVSSSSSCAPG